ncbi:hypothetical protein [Spirosoma radiotolerans]|uniref:Uncharacterized protein n=1 Tax=Spirosoma radiotolerans TaxID=1379870 RepID=A0A0E3V8N3_9BACT|nr:hypothetical protein [Spirosoma radiotolerans]AKD56451.1 hypothetical protein SD10_17590 [Spirosoma radiotolerans]
MPKVAYLGVVSLCMSASLTLAQNANQAAVDTLTKDVAIAVFAGISQPKAQEIYTQLLECSDGCDPQQVIRGVGSWDQVGAKMQELAMLKNTAAFVAMSPAEANTAIRKQLAQFYAKYKSDKNYGKPLSPAVQAQILAKVDGLLPPAAAPEPSAQTADKPAASDAAADDETGITPEALQLSQLERQKKEAEGKQLWMMILGALAGLVVGAGAVYLLAYRALKNEVDRLTDENGKLSRQNDSLLRSKPANEPRPTNEPRQPQGDLRQKASAYDAIITELGTNNPLVAIQQLKQQAAQPTPPPAPRVRSGEPVIETGSITDPMPVLTQPIAPPAAPIAVPPTPVEAPAPARSEVVYFPPPDPTGQFDSQQKSGTLSPESAYRFSINASNPSVASFRFEAEPGRVARFLTYRNYMIEPACDSENSYTSTHTRIVMRRDGEAVLENGVWRVKTKALIRYE